MRASLRWAGTVLVPFLFVSLSQPSFAQSDKAAAEALFDEGRRMMDSGDFASACPKFEASQRMDPGVGTMLYLADCYEKTGRTASAWAQFREVISVAANAGSKDRERIATQRAAALEGRLSYLTIVPWKGQSVAVTRDGNPVDPAVLGTAIPVDPGRHVVVAAAEGKREWSTTVDVKDGAKVSVSVPILPEDAGDGAVTAPAATPRDAGPSDSGGDPGSTQRTVAIVAGGVGVVGLAVGTIFGLSAQSKWSDAQDQCEGDVCTQKGEDLSKDALSSATISTVGFIVGGVGLAGGAVLWLTAPSSNAPAVGLVATPGSLLVKGRF